MSTPLVISSVEFPNNPASWKDPYKVEIVFEAHEDLPKDAEWQLTYVGSADESDDQVLESVVIGPITKGRHKFAFEADAPDESKIAPESIHDIALLLLKCHYDGKMFSKIGWFVANEYEDEELQLNKPAKPIIEKLKRQIQIEDVRVTNYSCAWREEEPPVVQDVDEDDDIAFSTADKIPDDEEEDEVTDDEEEDLIDENVIHAEYEKMQI